MDSIDFSDLLLEAFSGLDTAKWKSLHYLLTSEFLENRLKTTPSNTEGRDEWKLFLRFLVLIRTGVQ